MPLVWGNGDAHTYNDNHTGENWDASAGKSVGNSEQLFNDGCHYCFAMSSPVTAQTATSPTASQVDNSMSASAIEDKGIAEIVVTARYRKESVQSTPVSVTALGSNELKARGIASVSDIGNAVSNVTIQPSPANGGKSA